MNKSAFWHQRKNQAFRSWLAYTLATLRVQTKRFRSVIEKRNVKYEDGQKYPVTWYYVQDREELSDKDSM
jgi:hypothetical protein